jgi:hypothetical protein
LANVFSFHTGRPLALWERCSLQSFADHGHQITLYAYGPLALPKGVTLGDASTIISNHEKDLFFASAPGMFAQFSDLFRLEMMVRHGGWWVDTDVICFSDALPLEQVWITHYKTVQNSIMHFPPDHEFMRAAAAEARKRIHALDSRRRTVIGPDLLKELGASERLQIEYIPRGSSCCFKLHGGRVGELGEPALDEALNEELAECPMLHWWSELFRELDMRRDLLPPRGSYLAAVFERHGGTGQMNMDLSEWRACTAKIALVRKRKRRVQLIKRIKKLILRPLSAVWGVPPHL